MGVKLYELSAALKRKPTGCPQSATTSENVSRVRVAVQQSPRRLALKHSGALRLSNRSARIIFHRDLQMHPFKIMVIQE